MTRSNAVFFVLAGLSVNARRAYFNQIPNNTAGFAAIQGGRSLLGHGPSGYSAVAKSWQNPSAEGWVGQTGYDKAPYSVCRVDSDGDGFSNGEEMGDADCDGKSDAGFDIANATDPNDASSFPKKVEKAPEAETKPEEAWGEEKKAGAEAEGEAGKKAESEAEGEAGKKAESEGEAGKWTESEAEGEAGKKATKTPEAEAAQQAQLAAALPALLAKFNAFDIPQAQKTQILGKVNALSLDDKWALMEGIKDLDDKGLQDMLVAKFGAAAPTKGEAAQADAAVDDEKTKAAKAELQEKLPGLLAQFNAFPIPQAQKTEILGKLTVMDFETQYGLLKNVEGMDAKQMQDFLVTTYSDAPKQQPKEDVKDEVADDAENNAVRSFSIVALLAFLC